MTNIRNFVAAGAAVAFVAVGCNAVAEESAELANAASAVEAAPSDAELLENIRTTEKLRRESLDQQAKREIAYARECMSDEAYDEAVNHYALAKKLLNDRPASKEFVEECQEGMAEGLYRAALQEDDLGRREEAIAKMEKARAMRHPKALGVLTDWADEANTFKPQETAVDHKHRINDTDYKQTRESARKHLRRSRQYLAVRDMENALNEVEVVLVKNPANQEAIRLRDAIQKKRHTIITQEREATRDGMIADVDNAWRPVYAVNAPQLDGVGAETVKVGVGEDSERTQELEIERRMKAMRLPTISFRPPATIMDAVDFFTQASKDYDRPDLPVEKRGFNFVLRTPQGSLKQAAGGEDDDFGDGAAAASGLDPIPTITASDITFYEALKLVCDSVNYKFIIRGPVVMVMHKDMSTSELLARKYNVPDAFVERVNTASSEMKEMGGFGAKKKAAASNNSEEEGEDRDWKAFFEEMGVKWPEGSSVKYLKSLGKLYVRNTRENLAEFEKVLEELGSQPMLIEIETRFVEVSQEDLNSLGFEWILNSDYSINLGDKLGKALGVRNGAWGNTGSSRSASTETVTETLNGSTITSTLENDTITSSTTRNYNGSNGSRWGRFDDGQRAVGVNAFGGTSGYANGNRYLSTSGNHITGENATNDQFMRVNAFLGSADLSMILHMLSQRSDTDLLSAPKVVTRSGEQAIIKVVTEYIYPQDYDVQLQSSSSSSSSSGGSSSAILAVVEPQNFTMREVGVILDVTPTYSEANGGTIDLELKPQVVDEPTWKNYGMKIPFTGNAANGGLIDPSTYFSWIPGATEKLGSAVSTLLDANASQIASSYVNSAIDAMNPSTITYYDAPMEQPFFHVRSIDSKVSITPGATVVMGGLITESRKAMDDKVPFLGDLPFIGRFFRSHAENTIKRNLLIFVTGRLINSAGREMKLGGENGEEADVKAAPSAE